MACPAENELQGLVEGALPPEASEPLHRHLDGCAECCALVGELARPEDPAASVKQVLGMIEEGFVTSLSGKRVPVAPDTLCLHGDQPGAVTFAKRLRETFKDYRLPTGE